MTFYVLPKVTLLLNPSNIKIKFTQESPKHFTNITLSKYLCKVKANIDLYSEEWDQIKKYTNPYEYIHTNSPHSKHPVSKIKPLSRAFFKFIEIANVFDIFKNKEEPLKSFHLAEGPGGFIEAIQLMRLNKKDIYYGMTLVDDNNQNVPGWNKSRQFLEKHSNVFIEKGEDGLGDLYNCENFKMCYNKFHQSMEVITGDGGFDFSIDFNKQEEQALRLIFTQVMYAISMQKYNGTFILKLFDTFLKSSVEILFLLSCFYEEVYIVKPQTSRYANSEKYVVCKYFKYKDTSAICEKFYNILKVLNNIDFSTTCISSLLDLKMNFRFLSCVQEINSIFGQQQMENILMTLRFIQNKERKGEKLEHLKNKNIQKCISWCVKNNIPHYKPHGTRNLFLGK